MHIYKNLIYCQYINLDTEPDLQLLMQLKLFMPLLNNSDNGFYTCSIFIDVSKVFDTVNFKILLEKLYFNFGIRGSPLQLFTSHISNRQRYTTIKNAKSPQIVLVGTIRVSSRATFVNNVCE